VPPGPPRRWRSGCLRRYRKPPHGRSSLQAAGALREHLRDLDLQSGSVLQSLRPELQLRESERRYAIPGIVSEPPTGEAESQLRRLPDGRGEAGRRSEAKRWPALRPADRNVGSV